MQENATLAVHLKTLFYIEIAKCIYLYLLPFLLWYQSDIDMQECSQYRTAGFFVGENFHEREQSHYLQEKIRE